MSGLDRVDELLLRNHGCLDRAIRDLSVAKGN